MKQRILAIEDNPDFLQIFRHLMEAMGYDLTSATTAHAGLEIAKEINPHIIFCDLGLPGGMDGFGFAQSVREDPQLRDIPLIAVSARTEEEDRQRALTCGFDRIFPKPVKFADIREVMMLFANGRPAPNPGGG